MKSARLAGCVHLRCVLSAYAPLLCQGRAKAKQVAVRDWSGLGTQAGRIRHFLLYIPENK